MLTFFVSGSGVAAICRDGLDADDDEANAVSAGDGNAASTDFPAAMPGMTLARLALNVLRNAFSIAGSGKTVLSLASNWSVGSPTKSASVICATPSMWPLGHVYMSVMLLRDGHVELSATPSRHASARTSLNINGRKRGKEGSFSLSKALLTCTPSRDNG